ncbi:MAG TPA: hypothetical protein PLU64_15235, partial [Saprospiraceae bacterium]|nr:hypothetical protein [Saprospiraceae bacterium]
GSINVANFSPIRSKDRFFIGGRIMAIDFIEGKPPRFQKYPFYTWHALSFVNPADDFHQATVRS